MSNYLLTCIQRQVWLFQSWWPNSVSLYLAPLYSLTRNVYSLMFCKGQHLHLEFWLWPASFILHVRSKPCPWIRFYPKKGSIESFDEVHQVLQDDLQLTHQDQSDLRDECALKMHEVPRPCRPFSGTDCPPPRGTSTNQVSTEQHPYTSKNRIETVSHVAHHEHASWSQVIDGHGTSSKRIWCPPCNNCAGTLITSAPIQIAMCGPWWILCSRYAAKCWQTCLRWFLTASAGLAGVQVETAVPYLSSSVILNIWESGISQGQEWPTFLFPSSVLSCCGGGWFSFLLISLVLFGLPCSGWTHIHANWWKVVPTICTEARPNSQFGYSLPSANLLFNRTVCLNHANVSNAKSTTQTFPVVLVTDWNCVGPCMRKYWACSTWWRSLSFLCSGVLGAASLTSSHASNIFHMKTTLKNMFKILTVLVTSTCPCGDCPRTMFNSNAHYNHTWVRRTTGGNNVTTWMEVKPLTKKTVPKCVVATTLSPK